MYRKTNLLWLADHSYKETAEELENTSAQIYDITNSSQLDFLKKEIKDNQIEIDVLVIHENWLQPWFEQKLKLDGITTNINCSIIISLIDNDAELVENCYLNGAKEVLINPSKLIMLTRISDHIAYKMEKHQTSQQLSEASQMAMLAMTDASDLGKMIKFAETAISASRFSELGTAILEFIEVSCEFALVKIDTNDSARYYGTNNYIDPDLHRLINKSSHEERVVRHDDILELNASGISILLAGLPIHEPDKFGRIQDSLATFILLSERFVEMILNLEMLAKQDKAQKLFLSVLGHELKTPLNAIQGFSSILAKKLSEQNDKSSSSESEICTRIQKNSWKLSSLIEMGIDLERISRRQLENLHYNDINFDHIISKQKSYFHSILSLGNINFVFENKIEQRFSCDYERVNLLVSSLITNAIEEMQTGSITVIGSLEKSKKGTQVCITLSDSCQQLNDEAIKQLSRNLSFKNAIKKNKNSRRGISFYYGKLLCSLLGGEMLVERLKPKGLEIKLLFDFIEAK
ncbi:sensor histidine kinase [Aliikangiella sp. IMCC44359]|uniref:sensor histidine kinase n=1 Tax=Aliikangiella sp. IMCC44359 TaxID=3459125 RepID=UPI00403B08CA